MCASLQSSPWCSLLLFPCCLIFCILRQEVCRCIAGRCFPLFRSHDIPFIVLSGKFFGFRPMLRCPFCRDIGGWIVWVYDLTTMSLSSRRRVSGWRFPMWRLSFCRAIVKVFYGPADATILVYRAVGEEEKGRARSYDRRLIVWSEPNFKGSTMLRRWFNRITLQRSS